MWQHLMVYPPTQALFEEIRSQGTQLEDKHQARSLLQEVLTSVNEFAVKQTEQAAPIEEFAHATLELLKTVSLKVMGYVTRVLAGPLPTGISSVAESVSEPIKIVLFAVNKCDLSDGGLASQWCGVIGTDWTSIESIDILFGNHKLFQQIIDFTRDLTGKLNTALSEHKLSEIDLAPLFSDRGNP